MQRMRDRILIIDMESSRGEELVPALAKAGFSVACVPSYPEAMLSLEVLKPDVIILSHASEESLEVCHQLYTAFCLPVILFGEDYSKDIWRKALLEADADIYVRKPFCTEELVARIKVILRRYSRRMPKVTDQVAARRN